MPDKDVMAGHIEAHTRDSALASLVTVAAVHGIAADPRQLAQACATPGTGADEHELVRAAGLLGLRARRLRPSPRRLATLPLPLIVRLVDGAFAVLAGIDDERVLLKHPGRPPAMVTRAAFAGAWAGSAVLVARQNDDSGAPRRFGFAWFWPHLVRHRRHLGEVLVAAFALQLLALATPLVFQVVIDKVLVHHGLTTLDILAVALLAVALFEVALGALRTYVLAHTAQRIDVALGGELFAHLLRLPLAWFGARRVGDSVARVRELETIRAFLTGSALGCAIDVPFTGVFLGALLLYSPVLTLVVVATLPVYALLALLATPLLRARLEARFGRGADNQAYLVETVSGIETLKALAVEPAIERGFGERLAAYVRADLAATNLASIANQAAALVNKLMGLGILWLGAQRVLDGSLSIGQLVAFNMIAARVAGPLLRLVQLWQDYQQTALAVARVGDILDARAEPAHRAGRATPAELRGEVRFETVDFRYGLDGPLVLDRFSVAIGAGEVVGIVGRSGCGKSTLARLLQRLHVPQRGRVLLDGLDLALLDPSWLRRRVAVVPQEAVLFNRTVRENIALADPALPLDRVVAAARAAGAHEFVLDLPDGYDTVLGEHASRLSGGQRQRLALARALATEPAVLILDEATSALDFEAEQVVLDSLRRLAGRCTVIVIAHRLSALAIVDRIVVLENGRVSADGPDAELRVAGGYYAGLCRHQGSAGRAVRARGR
ncbi:MAG: type I secretion system permease/ATPase [Gammaproteobacteria bacterium]